MKHYTCPQYPTESELWMTRQLLTYVRDNIKVVDALDDFNAELARYNKKMEFMATVMKCQKGIPPHDVINKDMDQQCYTRLIALVNKLTK